MTATDTAKSEITTPRVCVCVLMNHPFPQNIPLLRRIYQDRFSSLLFLIPLERMPDDPDVVTVYRGSYVHAAYITDARERLLAIDCDYFIFVHDDVLLNPKLDERTFRELFPIGPDDAYISDFAGTGGAIGHWTWFFGCTPKMLYPKSQLFGSGIESATLRKYLPSLDTFREKLSARGLHVGAELVLTHEEFDDVARQPSRVLLHGLSAPLSSSADPDQAEHDRVCLAVEHGLVDAMITAMGPRPEADGKQQAPVAVELPIPLMASGYLSDLYIVPRSRLAEYAHNIGVASAANIFVELVVASMLHVSCERVWTAKELGLDASGFQIAPDLERFADPRFLAFHPYKFSPLNSAELQYDFIDRLDAIRLGRPMPRRRDLAGFEHLSGGGLTVWAEDGWHAAEPWGRWAAASPATLAFTLDPTASATGLELVLSAPLSGSRPRMEGAVSLNGGERRSFAADLDHPLVKVVLGVDDIRFGENTIEVFADEVLRPSELDPNNQDDRPISFGLLQLGLC